MTDVEGRRRRHGAGGHGQKAEAPALDMLDDYWFFSNSLVKDGKGKRPPMLPKSPSTSSGGRTKPGSDQPNRSRFNEPSGRRLLRTPSLPSRRVGMEPPKNEEEAAVADPEVEDDDLNWSAIYEGVLLTRMAEEGGGRSAPLDRAPSMPVPSSERMDSRGAAGTMSTPSMPRLRHSHSALGRNYRSPTPTKAERTTPRTSGEKASRQPRRELRSFSANQQPSIARQFQDKKWKSSSDLESIEVQGFKDLGFVFDQEELRESLADVLPGLRGSKSKPNGTGSRSGSASASGSDTEDANVKSIGVGNAGAGADGGAVVVRRPYLSEAWQHGQRSAPPASMIKLQQSDARSAAEMKDQIRMWAQAVACNVRQEC